MADFRSNPMLFYPGDAPGKIGFDSPSNGYIGIERIVWRRTQTSTPADGDSVILKCDFGKTSERDLFHRIWSDSENDVQMEYFETGPFKDLYVTSMDSGVLEIHVC